MVDAKTKEPLINASVYLNGTTIGNVTDAEGRFELFPKEHIFAQLIISYTGYEKTVIENPFEFMPDTIFLKESDNTLNEVVVKGGKARFTEKQKRKAFREQFLGMSKGGKSCKILNEDSIRLIYDPEANELHAYCNVPVEVENPYLGYRIRWELIDFTLVLNHRKSLYHGNLKHISVIGTASFTDLEPDNDKVNKRREDDYKLSKNRFFKLLANGELEGSNIHLIQVGKDGKGFGASCHYGNWFNVPNNYTDENNVKDIAVNKYATRNAAGEVSVIVIISLRHITDIRGSFLMKTYYIDSHSKFNFLADTFKVDMYGNTNLTKDFYILGDMGNMRLGDQLPTDYLPQ
ncbi:hypothetical protein AGMMS50239_32050 [Bacteroidia bacterium]|nr:hypothetical protein AGMMS50239_32050 [Bacteroidia bacterium]